MGSKIFIVLFFIISCNEIFCRFNKVQDPPYPNPDNIDHNYTYVVWTGKEDNVWISCYDQYISRCEFRCMLI